MEAVSPLCCNNLYQHRELIRFWFVNSFCRALLHGVVHRHWLRGVSGEIYAVYFNITHLKDVAAAEYWYSSPDQSIVAERLQGPHSTTEKQRRDRYRSELMLRREAFLLLLIPYTLLYILKVLRTCTNTYILYIESELHTGIIFMFQSGLTLLSKKWVEYAFQQLWRAAYTYVFLNS